MRAQDGCFLVAITAARCSDQKSAWHVSCFRHACKGAAFAMLAGALCKSRDYLVAQERRPCERQRCLWQG